MMNNAVYYSIPLVFGFSLVIAILPLIYSSLLYLFTLLALFIYIFFFFASTGGSFILLGGYLVLAYAGSVLILFYFTQQSINPSFFREFRQITQTTHTVIIVIILAATYYHYLTLNRMGVIASKGLKSSTVKKTVTHLLLYYIKIYCTPYLPVAPQQIKGTYLMYWINSFIIGKKYNKITNYLRLNSSFKNRFLKQALGKLYFANTASSFNNTFFPITLYGKDTPWFVKVRFKLLLNTKIRIYINRLKSKTTILNIKHKPFILYSKYRGLIKISHNFTEPSLCFKKVFLVSTATINTIKSSVTILFYTYPETVILLGLHLTIAVVGSVLIFSFK